MGTRPNDKRRYNRRPKGPAARYLMRHALYLPLIFGFTVTVFAQTATKPPVSTAKAISGYMRRTGLSYLEQIDDFQRECDGLKDSCAAALDRWPRTFEAMEDRITITLSESQRSAGDQPFFELLKHAKDSEISTFSLAFQLRDSKKSYSTKKTLDMRSELSSTCKLLAHRIALDGIYNASADVCAIKYKEIEECRSRHQGADGFYWEGVCHTVDQTDVADQADPDVQGAAERKQFAHAAQERFVKRIPSLNVTTDGPDATIFVWHATGVTKATCQDLFTGVLASVLAKYRFSQFACTDGNARFTFDLTAK